MASPESVIHRLSAASTLLNRAAGEIRDAGLPPARTNITRIGKALAEIFEIEMAIHAAHPHLRPDELREKSPHSDSERRLTAAMIEALDHEERGGVAQAVDIYRVYLDQEQTPRHREIAQGEIDRLQRGRDG